MFTDPSGLKKFVALAMYAQVPPGREKRHQDCLDRFPAPEGKDPLDADQIACIIKCYKKYLDDPLGKGFDPLACVKKECIWGDIEDTLKKWNAMLFCCNLVGKYGDPCICSEKEAKNMSLKKKPPCYNPGDIENPKSFSPQSRCLECCDWLACVQFWSKLQFDLGDFMREILKGGFQHGRCVGCCSAV